MKRLIFILPLALLFTNCTSKVYYTKYVRDELEKVGITPNQLQFFTDKQIVLQRNLNDYDKTITQGAVSINKTIIRDRIVFGDRINNVQGICKRYSNNILSLYFEEGDEIKRVIPFMLDDNGFYTFATKKSIFYDGELYEVQEGNFTRLKIKNSVWTKNARQTRKVKGLRIQN